MSGGARSEEEGVGLADRRSIPEDPIARIERVYRAEGDRMWRALLVHTGDPDIAADAVAEAFTQAIHRGAELREPERWVWAVAFRVAAGELKRRGAVTHTVEDQGPEPRADLPEEVIMLTDALRRLSPMQRGSVILYYYEHRTSAEAARILGTTSAAVRVHLFRARRNLARVMGVTDRDGSS